MSAPRIHAGYTLVELLVGLAIAAVILLPLADLLRSSTDSAQLVRTRLDLHADAGFALDRIADKASRDGTATDKAADPRAAVTPDSSADANAKAETTKWLTKLGFCEYRDEKKEKPSELREAVSCTGHPGSGVIASNLTRIEVTSPNTDAAALTLRIVLTLGTVDAAVTRSRTVRIGAYQ